MCKPSSQLHSFLSTTLLRPSEELIIWVWREGLGRGQEFNSQHPHGLQPSRTPELDLTLFSPPSTHMHKHIYASKTLLHVKKVKFKKKKVILKVFGKHLNKGPPYLLDQIKSILTALTVFSNASYQTAFSRLLWSDRIVLSASHGPDKPPFPNSQSCSLP